MDSTGIWLACFSEAWSAFVDGSAPIGAVYVDAAGEIRFRGRNRINQTESAVPQVVHSRLAHAEVNCLVQAPPKRSGNLGKALSTPPSNHAPCVLARS